MFDTSWVGGNEQRPERLVLLVEQVRDYAIFMLDTGGHVMTWNAGAERIKGYRAEEIIGRHFCAFYTSRRPSRATTRPTSSRSRSREGRFEEEGWRVRKDGTRFWANVVITAIHDRDGEPSGFAKVTRDLTERRAARRRTCCARQLPSSSGSPFAARRTTWPSRCAPSAASRT